MIVAFVILGVALLVIATFVPSPIGNAASIAGWVLVAAGLVLLALTLLGVPVVAW